MRKEYINSEVVRLIGQAAEEHGIAVKKIAVAVDHVHVRVALPFTMSPSRALMYLKGRSSYLIFRRFPNFRKRYPRGSFWSPGKFMRSISEVTSEVVDEYIGKQQMHKLETALIENDGMFGQSSLTAFM
jgi:REP element-mobilizing transposase RayT